MFGQEGSRGFASAREHRLAMRITSKNDVGYGVEVMKAWGVLGDASLEPLSASFWFRTRPQKGLWGYIRSDVLHYDSPSSLSAMGGVGYGFSPRTHLVFAVNQTWVWDMGYLSTASQTWSQSYYLQLQYDLQTGFSWKP